MENQLHFEIQALDNRTDALINELTCVWEASVTATHTFLSPAEIQTIKGYVPQAFKGVQHLLVAKLAGRIVGLMGIDNQRLEMLFLLPEMRGCGLGRKLLERAFTQFDVNEVTVNEQNPEAVGFYGHMGFTVYKRTPVDEQGGPYPLLYMRRK